MRLSIVAVGRLKDGGERVLVDRYVSRLAANKGLGLGPLTERDIPESRLGSAPERMKDEAARLLAAAEGCDFIVALDERGKAHTSDVFARWLGQNRDAGRRHAAFLIGGADGHGAVVGARADLVLSLGMMTLPHGLARAILAEQLYRASTILMGHPYHRS